MEAGLSGPGSTLPPFTIQTLNRVCEATVFGPWTTGSPCAPGEGSRGEVQDRPRGLPATAGRKPRQSLSSHCTDDSKTGMGGGSGKEGAETAAETVFWRSAEHPSSESPTENRSARAPRKPPNQGRTTEAAGRAISRVRPGRGIARVPTGHSGNGL